MRRMDKEILDPEIIEQILYSNNIFRIAWVSDEGPYLLPLHYGYQGGSLFIHSAPEGKKIDLCRTNPRVCFEVSDSIQIVQADTPCGYTTRYRSVIGRGNIHILTDPNEKEEGLRILMRQITGKDSWNFSSSMVEKLVILRLDIEQVKGKKSKL